MIGLDTNLLVRIFAKDNPLQEAMVLELLEQLPEGERAVVNIVVIVELLWVLKRAYRFEQEALVRVLRSMAENKRLFLPNKEILLEAAHQVRENGGELPDMIIALLNREHGASVNYTFDVYSSKRDGFQILS
jgi:predicted nucleic-acid-binding protein